MLNGGELFDESWMNFDRISQYAPPNPAWSSNRPMRVEDVDVWEVITEMSGPVGVYAAWCPYGEFYIVTNGRSIVAEFSGWNANARLEQYLNANSIPYPKGPDVPVQEFVPNKLIVA